MIDIILAFVPLTPEHVRKFASLYAAIGDAEELARAVARPGDASFSAWDANEPVGYCIMSEWGAVERIAVRPGRDDGVTEALRRHALA